ncbi:HD-GYP domain-containing protein [Heliophilum fasciatum]|uniref:Putative nucleotidyltransferase with HDIG domain n=1 Tax=Heliophilum fasciatum TaxID=35700 RepID=A0A4R2RZB0_9FIRM|nr:HD domain-containing phosphohydrolase [Heliophilum fasciatum]MCW2277025.1 putative nucleotidyltransferase with HDIG domain [Heliophilum fasciatum]TCP68449.1 putative nucleotidyltransferase with HDIG domain [Heliophilum fasciatum]
MVSPVCSDHHNLLEPTHSLLQKLASHSQPALWHTQNVARKTRAFLTYLHTEPENALLITLAALLHDIGLLRVDAGILNKPMAIEPYEEVLFQAHPTHGEAILKEMGLFPQEIGMMIAQHHEQMDGSGYPRRVPCEQLLYGSHIIHLCDTFVSLQEETIRQKGRTPEEAWQHMSENAHLFHPELFQAFDRFIHRLDHLPVLTHPSFLLGAQL